MKVAKVLISAEILTAFFTQSSTAYMISKGLPFGAKLLDIIYDPNDRMATVVFTHNDFDEVKDGALAPELSLEIAAMVPNSMIPDHGYPQ